MSMTRHYRTTVQTAPAAEPITTAEAKTHLRVDHSHDDTYIGERITGARKFIENNTRRTLVNTTYKLFMDEFPDEVLLPHGNLQSVTHVKYYDTDGVQQTLSTSLYQVDTASLPGRVVPAVDESWPDIQVGKVNAIEIQYVAGFGAAGSNVPQDLRDAVMMMVAHRYEYREPIVAGTSIANVPLAVQTIIENNRIQEFF